MSNKLGECKKTFSISEKEKFEISYTMEKLWKVLLGSDLL